MVICFSFGAGALGFISAGFVILKGADYSLFASAKELLYFPLTAAQKYGTKYISDIVVYRFAKGLVSLLLIYFQELYIINWLMYLCLILWVISLVPLMKTYSLKSKES